MTDSYTEEELRSALDDMVKQGKLRKFWDDEIGDWQFIDARVPLTEKEKGGGRG